MMLITLTILLPLLPLVHSVEGTMCSATEMQTVHTSNLPNQIKDLIHKDGYILWNDQASLAIYYDGYPDLQKPQNRFTVACALGLENRPFRHCVNATYIDGVFGGNITTVEKFHEFYKACNNFVFPGFDEPEEEEDDFDEEKDETKQGLQDLAEAAGIGKEN